MLCNWLEEAVAKKPKEWVADSVQTFEKLNAMNIADIGKKLVVRKCYTELFSLIDAWLKEQFNKDGIKGALVITGTPGIGKSVFLAYVASRLAEDGAKIVIQLGNQWWSRIDGTCICHEESKPVRLLKDPETILLGDPVGGKNSQPILPRMCGCTIIFTSPQQNNYDSLWKQYEGRSERYFMPVWSADEVLNHWKTGGILQDCEKEEDVKLAFSMLGGSVRYLNKLLVAVSKNKTSLEVEAKKMIGDCISSSTFDDLCRAAKGNGADIDSKSDQSKMSHLLHIFSDDKFEAPCMKLIESKIVYSTLCEKMTSLEGEALPQMIRASLGLSPLAGLCGRLFQMHVHAELTKKEQKLQCRPLPTSKKAKDEEVRVPNTTKVLPKSEPSKPKSKFEKDRLYCPESETFPAADYFFFAKEGKDIRLWLLQVTKAKTHDCKIGAMFDLFEQNFDEEDVKTIKSIKWIIVAPKGEIADGYYNEQKVEKKGRKLNVEQYVNAWKM